MTTTAILVAAVAVALMYIMVRWSARRQDSLQFWKRQGLRGPEPSFLWGNFLQLSDPTTRMDVISGWLRDYGDVVGYYVGGAPYLLVKDMDMLKQVLISDFQYFKNRPDEFMSYPMDKTLIAIKDRKWKQVRSIISPAFSTRKIRVLFDIVNKKAGLTVDLLHKKGNAMFDMYELMQGLTLDTIACSALAMNTCCQTNTEDPLFRAARSIINSQKHVVTLLLFLVFERLMKATARRVTVVRIADIVIRSVCQVVAFRRANPASERTDLLHNMLDPNKDGERLSEEEIAKNACLLLLAGFETTSSALASTFHLLAEHPRVQERLHEEVESAGDITYDGLQKLRYLDQVLKESLRMYPPVPGFVSRVCSEDCKVGSMTVKKGTRVVSPVWHIHHDPDLWPEPDRFDPERFDPENKAAINSLAFQPFGAGPRNCIGLRFAQLEAKLVIFRLVKEFRFEMCEKTQQPFTMSCMMFTSYPSRGVWLRAVKRH